MATTRLGVGGPSAAYPGFTAKDTADLGSVADVEIDAVYSVSEDVVATAVTSEDITGTI